MVTYKLLISMLIDTVIYVSLFVCLFVLLGFFLFAFVFMFFCFPPHFSFNPQFKVEKTSFTFLIKTAFVVQYIFCSFVIFTGQL